jgi:hypothetical protein
MKKNIVFVGDSFCSNFREPCSIPPVYAQQYDYGKQSWLNVSSQELGLDLYSFGFSGRSWFYSRSQFFRHMNDNPSFRDSIELLVFCHTDSGRFNTGNGEIGNEMLVEDYRPDVNDPLRKNKLNKASALKIWFADLQDGALQDWSQEQWYYEIARDFSDIKQIHFNNYPFTQEKTARILGTVGMVYSTPLIHLSLGELTGTDKDITKHGMAQDQRTNHFSEINNRALAQVLVQAYQNYQIGVHEIDYNKFDIKNWNAFKWPGSGFGSA